MRFAAVHGVCPEAVEELLIISGGLALPAFSGRGSPVGDSLFFGYRPKKSMQKKCDLQSGFLRFASGELRCPGKTGVRANLAKA